jgi:hypothetical protein
VCLIIGKEISSFVQHCLDLRIGIPGSTGRLPGSKRINPVHPVIAAIPAIHAAHYLYTVSMLLVGVLSKLLDPRHCFLLMAWGGYCADDMYDHPDILLFLKVRMLLRIVQRPNVENIDPTQYNSGKAARQRQDDAKRLPNLQSEEKSRL